MAQQIQDEGFHEIQLNGKQLVFLFMAATVVSVVIFLCGVLVGRGVRSQLGVARRRHPGQQRRGDDAHGSPRRRLPRLPPAPIPRAAAPPPPAADDLSYFNRLEKSKAPAEKLKPASERPAASVEKPARAARARAGCRRTARDDSAGAETASPGTGTRSRSDPRSRGAAGLGDGAG